MGNRRHIFKNLLLGILMLLGVGMRAQEPRLERAQQLLRALKYDDAAKVIDSAIVHPLTSKDFITWTTRAYIYFNIYNRTDKGKLYSPLRDTVLISVRKSITLNPDSDYVSNNKKMLTSLSAHYFNIAKRLLEDSLNFERSLVAYNNYKDLTKLADANATADSRDVEYYNAVGSVYSDIWNKDNKNTAAQQTAKVALMKVLDMQPGNNSANMNLGLLYFNQAVNLVKELDASESFEKIDELQDNVVKLAKQAEQFILRVYTADPKNKKANIALYYIYRMLYDIPKSDEFKKRAEDLGERFDQPEENKNKTNQSQGK